MIAANEYFFLAILSFFCIAMSERKQALILILCTSALFLLLGSTNFISLLLAGEIASLCAAPLWLSRKEKTLGVELNVKHVVLHLGGTVLLLFALVALNAQFGSLEFQEIGLALQVSPNTHSLHSLAAFALLSIGFAIRLGLFPFHFWTIDAADSQPAAVSSFVIVPLRFAWFVKWCELTSDTFEPLMPEAVYPLVTLSCLSIAIGSLGALRQPSYKRALGYTMVFYTGLIVLAACRIRTLDGLPPELFSRCAFIFSLAWIGCRLFSYAIEKTFSNPCWPSFQGLFKKAPLLCIAHGVCALSLVGLPPAAGFFERSVLIQSILRSTGPLGLSAIAASTLAVAFTVLQPFSLGMKSPSNEVAAAITIEKETFLLFLMAGMLIALPWIQF